MQNKLDDDYDNDDEIEKAWSLRRISIVNVSSATDADDGHNYRHFVAGALQEFGRQWAAHPYTVQQDYGRHACSKACRMFEFVPPGRCSGDVFICWVSGNIHICTKDMCRFTEPQHGFPGFNNARRAVCHVCALTRRVFSVNPDQTVGGGGGGDDDDDAGGGVGFIECTVDDGGGRVLVEYDSDTATATAAPEAVLAPSSQRRRPISQKTSPPPPPPPDDPTGPSSKRKRATAAAASGPSSAVTVHRQLLHSTDCEYRERRIKIYAGMVRKLMPAAPIARVNAWVHIMEAVWAVIQRSPGFERNNSQLQPKLFALVCLNYMRNIGLSTKTLGGSRLIRVLPAVAYIREHMADIKHIGEHGFTQAERALMCCMNELPAEGKVKLEFNDKVYASFYAFSGRFVILILLRATLHLVGIHTID